jgi:hypothetical protein
MKYIPPKSMLFVPEAIPAAVKARTHLQKAEEIKEPHLRYLELWRGFEALYQEQARPTGKLMANRQDGRAALEMDIIGALLTLLTRPRVEQVLRHEDIPSLHSSLARKRMKRILGDNEFLMESGMTDALWQQARKDLTYNLTANYWKAAVALGRMLFVVRGACDPKIRKTDNLVSDTESLGYAYNILRMAMRSLVDQLAGADETFMGVGQRNEHAEQARKATREALQRRAKKA